MRDLLGDLKTLIEKHEKKEMPQRTLWLPICEHYKTAGSASLYEEKGGDTVSFGKYGGEVKVLYWLQVTINPESQCVVLIKKIIPTKPG